MTIKQSGKDKAASTNSIEQTVSPDAEPNINPAPLPMISDLVPLKKKKKRKKWIFLIVIVLIVAVAAFFYIKHVHNASKSAADTAYTTSAVERRDISVTLSGSGTLEPADSYIVKSLVSGEILSAPFEEGDIVQKDTVLYQVDSSDVSSSIERAENSLSQSQSNYDSKLKSLSDLNIKTKEAGSVVSLDVSVGDTVQSGQTVATIRNSGVMSLTLPFGADDAAGFYVGQSAKITLDGSFETLNGTITKISASDEVLSGNMIVRQVTIDVSNPGGISTSQTATAIVNGAACNSSGTFSYKSETTVKAEASGDVTKLNVSEGDAVSKGQVIAVLSSDNLENEIESAKNSLQDAQLSLQNQNDQLDKYAITSPISGTIVDKTCKEGDALESGDTLCTVFDLSYLTMTLNVDELDISQIKVGQNVTITAEAVAGKTFEGTVTKANINGTTDNGVTSYPVTIRIDKTDGLLPGMNVDAKIIVESRTNVLAVPVSAVSRGDRVLVKTDASDAAAADQNKNQYVKVPAGFTYKKVTLGISDEDYIEIVDGLSESDIIAIVQTPTAASTTAASVGMPFVAGGDNRQFAAGGGNRQFTTGSSTQTATSSSRQTSTGAASGTAGGRAQ